MGFRSQFQRKERETCRDQEQDYDGPGTRCPRHSGWETVGFWMDSFAARLLVQRRDAVGLRLLISDVGFGFVASRSFALQ